MGAARSIGTRGQLSVEEAANIRSRRAIYGNPGPSIAGLRAIGAATIRRPGPWSYESDPRFQLSCLMFYLREACEKT